ncbi:MAG TPA: hypothetical protein VJK48_06480 [Chlamydiales bacterium]|nr:hypothetical protein [Chlamydiales bacterium]
MDLFENLPSLTPAQFFGVMASCYYTEKAVGRGKKWLLPSMADLLDEDEFANVYAGWNEEGVSFFIEVDVPFLDPEKDFVELFIDTRDLKVKGVVSRFCHHFRFSPKEKREVTRFRGEDIHPLADSKNLGCDAEIGKNCYFLAIAIPADSLHGYDPLTFSRLGFTYQINRSDGPPSHFSVSSSDFTIEQHPATWGSLKLVR